MISAAPVIQGAPVIPAAPVTSAASMITTGPVLLPTEEEDELPPYPDIFQSEDVLEDAPFPPPPEDLPHNFNSYLFFCLFF